jgi:hypothetical protein
MVRNGSEAAICWSLQAWVLAWQWKKAIAAGMYILWQESTGDGVNGGHGEVLGEWLMERLIDSYVPIR